MEKILSGFKVVEIASVLAGPSAGMYLAELGAEVNKIENIRTGGDVTRSWRLPSEKDTEISAYYASINYGKTSTLLNFSHKEDLQKVHSLIADSDILITNFPGDKAEKYGLSPKELEKKYPALISANITGFGSNSDRLAYDLILQAESGFMSMNGEPDSPPTKMPVALIDLLAGHQTKEAILLGLLHKAKTGKGSHSEISLYDSAISSLANQANNYLMGGVIPQRIGSKHPNIAPYGEIFQTKDNRSVVFAIGSDRHFTSLTTLLGIPELTSDKRFNSNKSRVTNRAVLYELIQVKVKQLSADQLEKKCNSEKVPMAIIKNLKEVFHGGKNKLIKNYVSDSKQPLTAISQLASSTTYYKC